MKLARFGVSRAGLVLQDLIKEHKVSTRNIGSMINDLHVGLNFLYDAPDKRTFESMYKAMTLENFYAPTNIEEYIYLDDNDKEPFYHGVNDYDYQFRIIN